VLFDGVSTDAGFVTIRLPRLAHLSLPSPRGDSKDGGWPHRRL